ncbi:AAA family ATPase [Enterococcus sp. C57]|uniref:AAA family ATPase n=1 Tax=Enterococcus sp. C57 TaxID=3231318 RepID=UPI0034A06D1C
MIISYLEFEEQNQNIIIDFPTRENITKIDEGFYETTPNEEFVQDFFSNNIDFIYSIVGKNASGKTSLLKNIIRILEGEFKGNYIIVFEQNNNGIINYCYISTTQKIKINGKNIKKIDVNIFFNKVSTVLLTNMVDDNPIYKLDQKTINLSKTNLINQSESLQTFFSDEMTRNINFVANYKNDIKIEDYINLPSELNYSLEDNFFGLFKQKSNFIKHLATLAMERYNSSFLKQIIINTSWAVSEKYKELLYTNQHINYSEVEELLTINKYNFEDLIVYIEKTLPDIIGLKKKESSIQIGEKKWDFKDKHDEEAYNSFIKDSEEDPEENTFFNYFYKNKSYKINMKTVNAFIEALNKWKKLLDEYCTVFKDINIEPDYSGNMNGVIDIESIHNLTKFKEKNGTIWEDEIVYTWRNLSSGENAFLSIFSRLYEVKFEFNKFIVLVIDEGDMSFHPEWQQQWVNILTNILEEVFKINRFQIIVSTHSPFILSDLPNNNILLLGKDCYTDTHDLKLSFGSNIQDLLTHKFFINSGLTGAFAKNKINGVIDSLLENDTQPDKILDNKKIINMIGEPLVRKKVHDLYMEKMNDVISLESKLNELQKQIDYLQERLEKNEE